MKTNFVFLVLVSSLLVACERETSMIKAPIPSLQEVHLINGRLHFPSQEAFENARLAINSEKPLDLSSWHTQIGFHSMKAKDDVIQSDFEKVKDRIAYQNFCNKHKNYLYITPDSSISTQAYEPFLSQLLNVDGEIYIANRLIKYTNTHKINIEDGSEKKLKQALNQLVSDEKRGIWIAERTDSYVNFANSRYCHPNEIWHTLHGHSGVEHRIYAYYNVENKQSQLTYGVLINSTPMELKSYFNVHIKSQYQGFLNYWYRKRTVITWNVGWGVVANDVVKSPSFFHGTGWTSTISEINYSYEIRPNGLLIYWNEKEDNYYRFDYCTSFLQTPIMSGTKSCP